MSMYSDSEDSLFDDEWRNEMSALVKVVKKLHDQSSVQNKYKKSVSQFGSNINKKITNLKEEVISSGCKLNTSFKLKSNKLLQKWQNDEKKLEQDWNQLQNDLDNINLHDLKQCKRTETVTKLLKNAKRSFQVVDNMHQQQLTNEAKIFRHGMKKAAKKQRDAVNRDDLSRLKMKMQMLLSRL